MNYTLPRICKAKKGWYVHYRILNPLTGERKQWREKAGINYIDDLKLREKEALKIKQQLTELLESGWSPFLENTPAAERKIPLMDILQEYLKTKKTSVRVRSYQHYQWALKLFEEYLVKNKLQAIKSDKFNKTMAFGYSDFLLTDKQYSGKSHNNQISNMKVFFEMMCDREIIEKNPFKGIKKRPEEKGRLIVYSDTQKELIKQHMIDTDHPMFLFVQFVYYCFVRPNEIMQLQVKHIDFEFKRIQIPSYASKNRKQSSVDINEEFFELVKEKYQHLDPEFYLFGFGLKPGPISVHRNRASKSHQELLQELKITGLVLYDWKHAGARDFILSGGDPYRLMTMMRHHSLEQTMTYLRSLGVSMFDKSKTREHKF